MIRAPVFWLVAGALISFSASAQWVQLDPCGFKEGSDAYGTPKGKAPNIGPVWVWVPYVISVTTLKKREEHDVECSRLRLIQGQVTVVGSGEEIHRRLVGQ